MQLENQSRMNTELLSEEMALFNFRWKRTHINKLHKLAKCRGISASAIIKNLLLNEYKSEEVLNDLN